MDLGQGISLELQRVRLGKDREASLRLMYKNIPLVDPLGRIFTDPPAFFSWAHFSPRHFYLSPFVVPSILRQNSPDIKYK